LEEEVLNNNNDKKNIARKSTEITSKLSAIKRNVVRKQPIGRRNPKILTIQEKIIKFELF